MVKARASSVSSAVTGTAFIFIGRFADAVVGFLFSIIGARLMGKDVYGLVGATIGIVSILALLGDVGIPNATTKYISQYLAKKKFDHIRAAVLNSIMLEAVLGGLSAVLCFLMADSLAMVFGRPELGTFLRYGAPLAFFIPLLPALNAVFQGYQRQEFYALSNGLSGMIRLGASVILLSISPTVESALLGYLLGAMTSSCIFSILIVVSVLPGLGKKSAPRWPELRKMLGYSIPVMLTAASVMLFNWVGTLFLTRFAPAQEISWFNIAYGIVSIPLVLSTSIGAAFFPIVTDLHSRGKHKILSDSYARVVKFTSLVTLPSVLILVAVGQPLIFVLYGSEFLPAYASLVVLSVWGLVRPIAAISNAVSNGVGKPILNTKANIICLGLSLVLCTIFVPTGRPYPFDLIPLHGLMGASWAITISFSIGMSLQIYYALDATRTELPFAAWVKFLAASTISALLIVLILSQLYGFLSRQGVVMNLLMALGLGLMGLGIYIVLVKAMGVLDNTDVKMVAAMPLPMKGTILKIFKALV